MRALRIEFRIIKTITVACGKSITGLYTAPAYANLAGPVHRTPGHHGPPRHTPRHDEGGAPLDHRTLGPGDCLQKIKTNSEAVQLAGSERTPRQNAIVSAPCGLARPGVHVFQVGIEARI